MNANEAAGTAAADLDAAGAAAADFDAVGVGSGRDAPPRA
jgi:hypothetical protein